MGWSEPRNRGVLRRIEGEVRDEVRVRGAPGDGCLTFYYNIKIFSCQVGA